MASLRRAGWRLASASLSSSSRSPIPPRPSAILSQLRLNSTVPPPPPSTASTSPSDSDRIEAPKSGSTGPQQLGQIVPRLSMTFTCTANKCGHRSTHEFAKKSYEKGIVIVQCPECKARHLIADHIGWFKESTEDGKLRTVEDLLRARGESVRKGRVGFDGDIEYVEE